MSRHPYARRRRLVRLAAAVGTAGLAAATLVPAAPASAADATRNVIVVLKNQHPGLPADAANAAQRVRATAGDQAPLVREITARGGRARRSLHVVNAVAVTVSGAEQSRLEADPAVAEVVPDTMVAAPPGSARASERGAGASSTAPHSGLPQDVCPTDPAKPLLEPEALGQTSTEFADPAKASAHKIATGKGVRVAFLADGIDVDNPDFVRADGSKVFVDYQDFSGDGPDAVTSGAEAFGDASSIAAQGRETYDLSTFVVPDHPLPEGCTIRIRGIAPDASLVGLKVFPAGGFAFNSAILAALDHAVTVDHVNVINESFGSNQYPDTNDDPTAVFNEQLVAAGITVVASSGDAGPENTVGSPASTPGVLSVGATTSFRSYAQTGYYGFPLSNGTYASNNISALSSSGITQTGGTIDLVAPGDLNWALCSPDADVYLDCLDNNGNPSPIQQFGGSSESAPFVAGAAALVIQAYRDAHHGQTPPATLVERILTGSADDLGLPGILQGAGQLNSLRAVQLARTLPGTTVKHPGDGLLSDPTQLALTAEPGKSASGKVRITNTGDSTQAVTPELDGIKAIKDDRSSVVLAPTTDPVTISPFGAARSYVKSTFTVPPGASEVTASIAWPNPSLIVRLVLLDPSGTLEAYSLPQGFGNFATVDVRTPKAGKWTAIVMTNARTGYAGPVDLRTTSYRTVKVGSTSGRVTLRPGQSASVSFRTPADSGADNGYTLRTGDGGPVVPVVVRSLISTGRSGGTFSGTFSGGNGRAGVPNPSRSLAFDVPPGRDTLDVQLNLTGDFHEAVYGFLVDPDGQPVSERTNQVMVDDAEGLTVFGRSLQLYHANPRPGRWTFTFAVSGPVAGLSVETGYSGKVSYGGVRLNATGVPSKASAKLPAGVPVTATVQLTNTGVAQGDFFVDARLADKVDLPLAGTNTDFTIDPAPVAPFPAFAVPTQTDKLTVQATGDHPFNFEVSPFPADHLEDLAFEGDPDRIAGPAGLSPSVTVTDPVVAPQTWLALPSTIGPFTSTGPTTLTHFAATVHTRPFDAAVTSSTGDPLLASVQSPAPAATPLRLASGASATVTVTITPTGTKGTVVKGYLYVDSRDPVTGSTDELIAVPYTYTIG